MEDGEERRTFLQAKVNGTEVILDMPRAVVVDPQAGNHFFLSFLFFIVLAKMQLINDSNAVNNLFPGYIFWSDWGSKPHIGRSNLNGENPRIIYKKSESFINSIFVDSNNRRIFSADSQHDKIVAFRYKAAEL